MALPDPANRPTRPTALPLALAALLAAPGSQARAATPACPLDRPLPQLRIVTEPGRARRAATRLTLSWSDPTGQLGPMIAQRARAEASRLLEGLGTAVDWELEGMGPEGSTPRVSVVVLPRSPTPQGRRRSRLGATARSNGLPSSSWVFVDAIRTALGHRSARSEPMRGREALELWTAVGRVVAHEVVHALAPSHSHAEHGLMSTRFDRRHLLSHHVTLDRDCACAALAALERLADRTTGHRKRFPGG